ncbi:MAG: biopolymer transporter ExbD [Sphingobacteriales bacterium]|jgi:biopolymer transport protein ExbD|nr:MAG: biopolymer transporter ExbD [Sphingobacteriales bacterium]
MPKVKVPRKSTTIDMTAMCDVAFLLLSFFILATKFKPSEALEVKTPTSVNTKAAPEKDVVMITIDKEGKVYFSMSEKEKKEAALETILASKGLQMSAEAKKVFGKESSFIGVPIANLPSYFGLSEEEAKKVALPGIPVKDSSNNELNDWLRAALSAYEGEKMNLLVKGDNASQYGIFKNVINAFKKNDLLKFQMVTDPEGIPAGSELSKKQIKGEKLD